MAKTQGVIQAWMGMHSLAYAYASAPISVPPRFGGRVRSELQVTNHRVEGQEPLPVVYSLYSLLVFRAKKALGSFLISLFITCASSSQSTSRGIQTSYESDGEVINKKEGGGVNPYPNVLGIHNSGRPGGVALMASKLTSFLPSVALRDRQLRSSAHFNP
ncbi:hypothetical protein PIB30_059804 [Stylosanthes scabra]|uniref:Uncharacterized protein n=1 Tax=Stylosanthes scabra TaxID=79078 RepID=A0ABU6YLK7_9FABA|nr:hypothetical protein [Stylosanthes scabra]